MRNQILILLLALILPAVAQAVPETSAFGVERGSIEWKRAEMEEWLVKKATQSLSDFIKPNQFKVRARVTFREPSKAKKSVTHVNIGMFGTVAVLETGGEKAKPELGMFEKIARIDITLIVSDKVSESTAHNMALLIQQGIPVVKTDRIFTEVVRLEAPKMTYVDWIREFKWVIGLLGLAGLFFLAMYYILPRIRFQTAIKLGPAQAAAPPTVEALPFGKLRDAMMIPLEMMTPEESADSEVKGTGPVYSAAQSQGEDLMNSLLPQTLAAVELRRLRSLAMTLSIKECIDLIRSDVVLGSILVNLLPADKTTSILSQLAESDLNDLRTATLEWTSESLAKDAAALMETIRGFRSKGPSRTASSEKLKVFVEQVGPENEAGVFADLVRMERFEELAELARKSPPVELLPEFPFECLFAAFERLNFKEKANVLAVCPKPMADRLVPMKSLETVHPALRLEMERIKEDESALAKAQGAWQKFVNLAREAQHSNPAWGQAVRPLVEGWLWKASRGVVGMENTRTKGKSRGDAA